MNNAERRPVTVGGAVNDRETEGEVAVFSIVFHHSSEWMASDGASFVGWRCGNHLFNQDDLLGMFTASLGCYHGEKFTRQEKRNFHSLWGIICGIAATFTAT
eukprot:Selendium_serpulae@DN5694_c0_g1_i1.p1